METPVKNSLLAELKKQISEPARLTIAAATLAKLSLAISKDQEFAFEQLSKEEADDLDKVLTAVGTALRARCDVKSEPVLRKPKASEKRVLEKLSEELNLDMAWRNQIRAFDTEKGPIIVVEPHGLTSESYKEFATLETQGWRTSIDKRFASHFPGHAACVVLRPGKNSGLIPKPKPEPKPEPEATPKSKKKG